MKSVDKDVKVPLSIKIREVTALDLHGRRAIHMGNETVRGERPVSKVSGVSSLKARTVSDRKSEDSSKILANRKSRRCLDQCRVGSSHT